MRRTLRKRLTCARASVNISGVDTSTLIKEHTDERKREADAVATAAAEAGAAAKAAQRIHPAPQGAAAACAAQMIKTTTMHEEVMT